MDWTVEWKGRNGAYIARTLSQRRDIFVEQGMKSIEGDQSGPEDCRR